MTDKPTELKPCPLPWCDGEAELVTWHPDTEARHIRCVKCGCMTPSAHFMRTHAYAEWNHRPLEQQLIEALQYIEEHICDPHRGPKELYGAFGLDSGKAIEKLKAALRKAGV